MTESKSHDADARLETPKQLASRRRSNLRGRLKAAVSGVRAGGVEVERVEISDDDRIVVITSKAAAVTSAPDTDDLDRELAEFKVRNGEDRA